MIQPPDIVAPLRKDSDALAIQLIPEECHAPGGFAKLIAELIEFRDLLHVVELADPLVNDQIFLFIQPEREAPELVDKLGRLVWISHTTMVTSETTWAGCHYLTYPYEEIAFYL